MRTVHFFAPYYKQEKVALNLIQSLLTQTADNWKLTVWSDGDESLYRFIDKFGFMWSGDDRLKFVVREENSGHWGALLRKEFITDHLADDELVVNTTTEDIYIPKTVEYINQRTEDFIYWDFTHHQFDYNTINAMTQPRIKHIDWGSYALLGSLAKSVDMLPLKNGEQEEDAWLNFFADGIFVEYLFMQTPHLTRVRLPKVLFVKN